MAQRFWVGGTNSWNSTAGTKWAATSGGAGGESVPTSSDDVFFDASSGSGAVTVSSVAVNARNIDCTGFNGTLTGIQSSNIYGSLTLSSTMTFSYVGTMTFRSTSTGETITTAGKTINSQINFNGIGGSWILQDNLTTASKPINLSAGELDTNGKTVIISTFIASAFSNKTLTLGSSSFVLLNSDSFTTSGSANFTLDAGTSTIYGGALDLDFDCSGLTFYDVSATSAQNINLLGENTFNNFYVEDANYIYVYANQTINGAFTCIGSNSSTGRAYVKSDTNGVSRQITAGSVTLENIDFNSITGAGTATWSGTSVGDGGNNTNITFTPSVTRYWVGNGGNWSDTAHWASSSNGTPGESMPLIHDTVVFDSNSITSSGQTITHNAGRYPSIDYSSVLNSPTVTFSSRTEYYGDLILQSVSATTGTGTIVFYGSGTSIYNTGGLTIGRALEINTGVGTLSLGSDYTTSGTRTLTVVTGSFDANDYNIETSSFNSSYQNQRSIVMGSGNWKLTGAGTVWNVATTTNLTLTPESSTIILNNSSSFIKTFSGGSLTYNNIYFTGSGTGVLSIVGSNTFNNFKCDTPPHTIVFASSSTTTVDTFTVSGTSGNLMTLQASSSANWSLVKTGGSFSSSDYLSISKSTASPVNTWYAGRNSTDGGSNTGWNFVAYFVYLYTEVINIVPILSNFTQRLFSEFIQLSTFFIAAPVKILNETISISDAIYRIITKNLFEIIVLSESVIKSISRYFTENIQIIPNIIKQTIKMFVENVIVIGIFEIIRTKNFTENIQISSSLIKLPKYAFLYAKNQIGSIKVAITNKFSKVNVVNMDTGSARKLNIVNPGSSSANLKKTINMNTGSVRRPRL